MLKTILPSLPLAATKVSKYITLMTERSWRFCYYTTRTLISEGGAENDGHEIDGYENAGHVSGV